MSGRHFYLTANHISKWNSSNIFLTIVYFSIRVRAIQDHSILYIPSKIVIYFYVAILY